ncbi:phytanoyl-CoA dioxygenase family protein [Candidatus Poribacteria bacterium]|nr:phytanoyl-CoA dioxygenase family protein [Candidatus Poribacteria bacterium]
MSTFTSFGYALDTESEKMGELRESNDIVDDATALRQRIAEDGYLFLRGVLDKEVVLAARREILEKLASIGEIDTRYPLMEGIFSGRSERPHIDTRQFSKDLRTGEAIRALVHRGNVIRFYEKFLGGAVRPFDYIWLRTVKVGGATGSHYDWVYMGRGTRNLYTSWIPIGDVPKIEGALLILENSHKLEELKNTYGAMDVDRDVDGPYAGGWFSRNPLEVQERFGTRWLTTDFEAGDMLVFTMHTMHCSLDNCSPTNRIRITSDTRYQLASEPVDERWIGEEPIAHSGRKKSGK